MARSYYYFNPHGNTVLYILSYLDPFFVLIPEVKKKFVANAGIEPTTSAPQSVTLLTEL